jgi:hypothetical protein
MEVAMFRASTRILAGIVLISSAAGFAPEVAYADDVCTSGSIKAGATTTFTYNLDASKRSHFLLDTDQQDVAMQIVDDANNIACQTSLPNPGHQTCGWMPVEGAVYTVTLLRPLATTAADAASAPIPSSDESGEVVNIGQGAAADASASTDNSDSPANPAATPVAQVITPMLPPPDATFSLCSSQAE